MVIHTTAHAQVKFLLLANFILGRDEHINFLLAQCGDKAVHHTSLQKVHRSLKEAQFESYQRNAQGSHRAFMVWPLPSCQASSFDILQLVLYVPTTIFISPNTPCFARILCLSLPCYLCLEVFPTPHSLHSIIYLENFQKIPGERLWNFLDARSLLCRHTYLPLYYLFFFFFKK